VEIRTFDSKYDLQKKVCASSENAFFYLTCLYRYAASRMEFANNSLKSPKMGKLNIDTLIIPQGL